MDAMYRSLFENAVEGIFRTTPDGHYEAANPALARIYGYETPEALMAELTDIAGQLYVDPRRREAFLAQMERDGQVLNFESAVHRKDGSTIWIAENVRAVRDADGAVTCYEGFVVDITDRKQAEEELRRMMEELDQRVEARTRALQESEQTIRDLMDVIEESVILLDRTGVVLAVNERGAARYGRSVEDLVGESIYEVLPADLAARRRKRNEFVLTTGRPTRWKDKREDMLLETAVYPMPGPDGTSERLVIVSRDASEGL